MRTVITLSASVLLVAASSCRARPTTQSANVVILLTDTVRADHLRQYGYSRDTSPFFDTFAGRHISFENAYAPSSWTRPSVASLFTGTYPQRHGVEHRLAALSDDLPTLASLLRDRGLTTIAVTTNPHVTAHWGMTRGFDQVFELMPDADRLKHGNDAAVVAGFVDGVLPEIEPPFFLYIHMIDPHGPYEPPAEELHALGVSSVNPRPLDLYDGEVRYADRHVGHIVRNLDDAGLLDNSLVVLTSDHGEELGDHGGMGHGHTLYQEVVRVPLAMRLPRSLVTGGVCPRVRTNVSLVDVFPTIVSLLGMEPPMTVDGRDVSDTLRCRHLPEVPLFFSLDKERASLAGVLFANDKLIVDRAKATRRHFRLDVDPRESDVDLDPDAHERAANLARLLTEYEAGARPGLHLLLSGREGQAAHENVQLRLWTAGHIVRVEPHGVEPTDRWGLSEDRSRLWLDTHLRSQWQRSPKHIWAQDRDLWILEIEPIDAPIHVWVHVDGKPAGRSFTNMPVTDRWPLITTGRRVQRPSPVDSRAPGFYLFERVPASETVPEGDHRLDAALRVLGYR